MQDRLATTLFLAGFVSLAFAAQAAGQAAPLPPGFEVLGVNTTD